MQRGGGERVVIAMARALPGSPIHTSFFEAERTYHELAALDVRPMPMNRIGLLRDHHRVSFPLLAPAFSGLHVDADVTLCSSAGWAHGARADGAKVVYWHAPARWLYQLEQYTGGRRAARLAARSLAPALRRWDRAAVDTVDVHLANSTVIAQRVRGLYGVDVEVLAPPLMMDATSAQEPVAGIEPGYVLCVCRLLPYKNVDVVIEAARRTGQSLVIVGRGPERERLEADAPPSVRFLTDISDAQLRWVYANASGLVTAAYEDFGLTPLEAYAFGKPVAALRAGGFLDTVLEDETGVFFDEPEPDAVADGLRRLTATAWSADRLHERADRFSEARFAARLREVVEGAAR